MADYDATEKWGHLFRRLDEFTWSDEGMAEDVEWVAKAEEGLKIVRFVGYEDGPISVEAEDHQRDHLSYVSDVIETEDSLLVEVEEGGQFTLRKAPEYHGLP